MSRSASVPAVPRPVDTVIEFLEAEQARGVTHVLLDEGARDGLRDLLFRARAAKAPQEPPMSQPAPRPASQPALPSSPAAAPPQVIPTHVTAEGQTKTERLASLRTQAETWPAARALGTLRDTLVFATGNPDARIMFVGEAPGYEEEKKREPFVGPAGQKLTDILKAMGLAREDVYISTIVKFRPSMPRQTTNNRKPSPEEFAACLPFIRAEIDIVRPTCIVALGATAAEGLLGLDGIITEMRGSWLELAGIPVRVTYHPSCLLQTNTNLSIRRQLWEDMLEVMDKLAMPVSEKQRAFFLPKP